MIRKCRRLSPILQSVVLVAGIISIGCWFVNNDPITSPAYTRVANLSGAGGIAEPFGIAVLGDSIYVSDGQAGQIVRLKTGGSPEIFASGLNTPSAIAFSTDGELFVADTGSHTIKRISADGSVHAVAGVDMRSGDDDGPVHSATFNAPVGIAIATDGGIYVSDTYNDRVRVIRDGNVSTIGGSIRGFADGRGSGAQFDTPLGIPPWQDKLLVTDSGNRRIRVVEPNGEVWTLAGAGDGALRDGFPLDASFVSPAAVATDDAGRIFIADGNSIRVIGRRAFPYVETIAGGERGYADGAARLSRFNRPSGLGTGPHLELYVADSDNRTVRVISDQTERAESLAPVDDPLPLAGRWPFDPPMNAREVAGTLGEIRGEIGPANKPAWFHNGLDIAGAYGETTRFIRDETVLDPRAAENFGTSRELLRMPLIGYIHLRLGRDKDDRMFGDPRFQFELDVTGKPIGLRIPRGTRFAAGDTIGTLNSMNHVHLIAGRIGREVNALTALNLPGIGDSIPPVVEQVSLFDFDWQELSDDGPIKLSDRSRVIVRAYDRMDGNSERRRLGVYRVGYQLFSNGSPLGEIDWRISFARSPSNDAVRLAYAEGSRSGYTPDTIFNYIATNRVDGENAREDFLDMSTIAPGKYVLRVFAADYFGNITSKDVDVFK